MSDSHPLVEALRSSWPADDWLECGVLAAVSGGADSVALVRAMHELAPAAGKKLVIGHLNHALRGAESDADATFVAKLAEQLGLEAVIRSVQVAAQVRGGEGLEAAARRVRYRFLRETAETLGLRYVAVAHTADDQAETVLHRLLRGTGLRGLAGMSRVRTLGPAVSVIRPLLGVRRGHLRDYLLRTGQDWSEDQSNHDERFTRNRLRRKLIPVVEQEFGANVIEAICRTASLAGEGQAIVAGETLLLLERAVVRRDRQAVTLACHLFRTASPVLVREALREIWRLQHWPEQAMGFAEWADLASLATNEKVAPARMFPGGVRTARTERELELRRV